MKFNKNFYYSTVISIVVFFLESNHQNLNYKYYIVLSMMAIATLFLTIILSILFFKFFNDKI